jgi:hypothetical protein
MVVGLTVILSLALKCILRKLRRENVAHGYFLIFNKVD